jgi:hypothetical protein
MDTTNTDICDICTIIFPSVAYNFKIIWGNAIAALV